MIAASSSGQNFGALGAYLVGDDGRVGWAETRNMMEGMDGGTIDPEAVAAEMRDEASASGVTKPVYHVAIAFDPDDHPTEAEGRTAGRGRPLRTGGGSGRRSSGRNASSASGGRGGTGRSSRRCPRLRPGLRSGIAR